MLCPPGVRSDPKWGAALLVCVHKGVAVCGEWGRSTGLFLLGAELLVESAALKGDVNKNVELLRS